MSFTKKIAGFILLFFTLVAFSSCDKLKPGRPTDLNDVLSKGRLVVLADNNCLGYMVEGDSIFGFQYEIVKAFADSLNVELIISGFTDFHEAIRSIEKGDADLLATIMPVTTEYADRLAFSNPLFQSVLMLVQNRGSDSLPLKQVSTQQELALDTVYLTENSKYALRIKNLSDEIADTIFVAELKNVNNDSIIKLVADGVHKYAVCPAFFSKHYAERYPNLDFSLPLGFLQNYSWAVHINSLSLIEKLNEFLLNFVDSYEYRIIYRKYF